MSRSCPKKNGVTGLYMTVAPFFLLLPTLMVFAAENPIEVESLWVGETNQELPFRMPVEETDERQVSGGEMQYQMQLLQQEVQSLRGMVEELGNSLRRMRATEEDRYLELDSRIQDLSGSVTSTGSTKSSGRLQGFPRDGSRSSQIVQAVPGSESVSAIIDNGRTEEQERALYDNAIELTRNRQYDMAITQLQAVIEQYPDGNLAPNAYYWLGEVYAAKPNPDYESARNSLSQVITFFPQHTKAPDAAFKLGKVYHLMGDCERARDLLTQAINHPLSGISVTKLSETLLKKVGNCG